jgi:carboxymethylenebutenolidase
MTDDSRQAAIALYDRYTHEGLDRRAFMGELTRIAGSSAAASVLLAGIAADPASAAIVPPDDRRLRTSESNGQRRAGVSSRAIAPFRPPELSAAQCWSFTRIAA